MFKFGVFVRRVVYMQYEQFTSYSFVYISIYFHIHFNRFCLQFAVSFFTFFRKFLAIIAELIATVYNIYDLCAIIRFVQFCHVPDVKHEETSIKTFLYCVGIEWYNYRIEMCVYLWTHFPIHYVMKWKRKYKIITFQKSFVKRIASLCLLRIHFLVKR